MMALGDVLKSSFAARKQGGLILLTEGKLELEYELLRRDLGLWLVSWMFSCLIYFVWRLPVASVCGPGAVRVGYQPGKPKRSQFLTS